MLLYLSMFQLASGAPGIGGGSMADTGMDATNGHRNDLHADPASFYLGLALLLAHSYSTPGVDAITAADPARIARPLPGTH